MNPLKFYTTQVLLDNTICESQMFTFDPDTNMGKVTEVFSRPMTLAEITAEKKQMTLVADSLLHPVADPERGVTAEALVQSLDSLQKAISLSSNDSQVL